MSTENTRPVRRQDRGERRIGQIVDAAAAIFADKGYEGSSTNMIAAQAGISPGSLYQFFRNKEEIAEALAHRYAAVFADALDEAFVVDAAQLPAAKLVDRIVDTLVAVNLGHPALGTVFRGWDAPPALAAAIQPLSESILDRVVAIVWRRQPDLQSEAVRRVAMTTIGIFRGLVPLTLVAPPEQRSAFAAELKKAMTAYIEMVDRDAGLRHR